ncbi:GNAT family N-acetyltransferase [Halobacillus locisalis]|uniref:GNAT family N-acetyltransferase n=1 Tax=Halobacillus locisalis TaxID=220753 RepID=A0A838CP20_9BACI|nr:GNAT family N-acetyltransferase [Halobacillus locisalis]MBA2173704.1 GNAT family N-acetyltransferase [Halobacillus locisalis]
MLCVLKKEDEQRLSTFLTEHKLAIDPYQEQCFLYKQNGEIRGVSSVRIFFNDAKEKETQTQVYVAPNYRNVGIGKSLYDHVEKVSRNSGADLITIYMTTDFCHSYQFCEKMGFQKWWGSPELLYEGEEFDAVALPFIVYEDKYFDQYVKMVQDAFYEIQKFNDLKPYIATEKIVNTYQLNNKENVYLLLDGEELLASVTVGEETLENLMVSPRYQGKGLGRKALQFGMNRLHKKGVRRVSICYMEGNMAAEQLYESVGFKLVKETHVYRKYIRKESS